MKNYLLIGLLLIANISFGQGTPVGAVGATQHNLGAATIDSNLKVPFRRLIPYVYCTRGADTVGTIFVNSADSSLWYMKKGRAQAWRVLTTGDTGAHVNTSNIATAALTWNDDYVQNLNHKQLFLNNGHKFIMTDDSGRITYATDTFFTAFKRSAFVSYHKADTDIIVMGTDLGGTGIAAIQIKNLGATELIIGCDSVSGIQFINASGASQMGMQIYHQQIMDVGVDTTLHTGYADFGIAGYFTEYSSVASHQSALTYLNGYVSLLLNHTTNTYAIGDISGFNNRMQFMVDDANKAYTYFSSAGNALSYNLEGLNSGHMRNELDADGSPAIVVAAVDSTLTVNNGTTVYSYSNIVSAHFSIGGYIKPHTGSCLTNYVLHWTDMASVAQTYSFTVAGSSNVMYPMPAVEIKAIGSTAITLTTTTSTCSVTADFGVSITRVK